MFNVRFFIFYIFVSVVIYNSAIAKKHCEIHNGFNRDKLEGKWNFVAEATSKPDKIRCGKMVLKREGVNTLIGYRSSYHGSQLSNVTITAKVSENIFGLQLYNIDKKAWSPVLPMTITSCNEDSELALEFPSRNLYLIFGRNTAVTPKFMKKYRSLAKQNKLKFVRMDNTNCKEIAN